MNPADSDPALNILAQLSNLGAAGSVGEGYNPLLEGTTPGFQELVGGMRGRGLDVVFVMDATQSMDEYFRQARQRIVDIIGVITGVLAVNDRPPRNLRFGVVAFKDYGDEFGIDATKALPLTADFDRVREFIDRIAVGGGADDPEPVDEALDRATNRRRMGWHRAKKNILILVGDARVHSTGRERALAIARTFVRQLNGTINAIDVGTTRQNVLPDFQLIAEAGGGSAYLLADKDKFWEELIVSVFGQRYKQDVSLIVERYAD
jgi:Mg-chelatase subunit ChlD